MDSGGCGFFGDGGGLSLLACLCPCFGLWLFRRYSSMRKKKGQKNVPSEDAYLKPPPAMVGACNDVNEMQKSAVVLCMDQPAASFADSAWQTPSPLDLDSASSSAGSPVRSLTSETALLPKSGHKSWEKEWRHEEKKKFGFGSPEGLSEEGLLEVDSRTSPIPEGDYAFDQLDEHSRSSGSADFSDDLDDYGVGGLEAQLVQPAVMPPARPGCGPQPFRGACHLHRYKTLGCHYCAGKGASFQLSAEALRAAAARALVPRLDLSSITGEKPAPRTTVGGLDVADASQGLGPAVGHAQTQPALPHPNLKPAKRLTKNSSAPDGKAARRLRSPAGQAARHASSSPRGKRKEGADVGRRETLKLPRKSVGARSGSNSRTASPAPPKASHHVETAMAQPLASHL